MLKVQSLIEKENDLNHAVEENNEACRKLVDFLQEITKKNPATISKSLFRHA